MAKQTDCGRVTCTFKVLYNLRIDTHGGISIVTARYFGNPIIRSSHGWLSCI